MKYPQLVSMPSAISDWLEEQLEARGIDAIVYTRYVLSLLHRDSLDLVTTDQDIQIPKKCGIESLVDELCEKLKHFESSTSDSTELDDEQLGGTNKSDKITISPNDLARRYYAAFPPLNYTKASSANDLITLIPQLYTNSSAVTAAASNKRKHGRKPVSHHYHQHRSTSRDALQPRNRTSAALDSDSSNMKSRSGGKQQRFSYFSRAKKDFGFARNMEKAAVDRSDLLSDWDLYFMNNNSSNHNNNRIGDEGYSTSDTTGVDESEDICEIVEHNSRTRCRKSSIDDGHLAKLVAKFDRRIEALWNTDVNGCVEETQNVENEYHDLPVDIQELLASPTKQESAAVELLNVANKWATMGDKISKPFIQCGTNITSSIWSECADEEADKSLYDSTISYCNLYNEALEKSSYSDNILGDQFNSLSMSAEKLSDDIFMAAAVSNKTSTSCANNNNNKKSGNRMAMAENEANMLYEEQCPTENNNLCCFTNMKLGSLKQNEFTSLPWELAFSVGNFNNKKWSDAENYSYMGDTTKLTSPPLDSGDNTGTGDDAFTTRTNTAVDNIITLLNHNKESSVFKEVVPKPGVTSAALFTVPAENDTSNTTTDTDSQQAQSSNGKEEEDLLTSTRTHFRPIKQETGATGNVVPCNGGSGAHYADGTTFAICSRWDQVSYRRSDSGTLYLESAFDTPKKYMEYRVKDVNGKCEPAYIGDDESCCDSIEREFVLKFCVKQNEKYCQTEQQVSANEGDVPAAAAVAHSPLEVPAKKRVLCDPEEFYFPGDEDLLSDSIDNSTGGSGTCECNCSRTRAKLATSLEPLFNASSETCSVHAARPDSMVSELAWNNNNNNNSKGSGAVGGVTSSWKKCDKCNNNWSTVVWPKEPPNTDHTAAPWHPRDVQSWQHIWSSNEELCRTCLGAPAGSGLPAGRSLEYFKLRDELTEDGEQLLSDLSCLQRNYMEQLPSSAEMSCDLNEPPLTTLASAPDVLDAGIIIAVSSKERKRRHSSSQRPLEPVPAAAVARNSWTNASCLRAEQRCPFTPPLLRPVTL
ncbi:hypothetical protein CBL_12196 [Carabus blaptoides fortunei]